MTNINQLMRLAEDKAVAAYKAKCEFEATAELVQRRLRESGQDTWPLRVAVSKWRERMHNIAKGSIR